MIVIGEPDPAIERCLGALAPRARVALAVEAARTTLPALAPLPGAQALAARGLDRVSAWLGGDELDARDLYAPIPSLLEQEANTDDAGKAALFAVLAALYYGTWTTARLEPDSAAARPLPSDVAEIGEDYARRAIDYALTAALDPPSERRRLIAFAERLAAG